MSRLRTIDDICPCIALLEQVHAADQYPAYWPKDPQTWLVHRREVRAWVAEQDGSIVGHIAIHDAQGDQALSIWQSLTKRAADQLGVVARLLVDPDTRGQGLGKQLLSAAVEDIHLRGQLPVLDVAEKNTSAVALYDKSKWRRLANFEVATPTDDPLPVIVYAGPEPPSADSSHFA